ncbi:acyl-CoA N-acyltransferase [Chytriomyces cf. hyalinus JEL632]|nr:acyl-CoA N-acyltransferase [Chytriomyces cf. hyalinus JEL632]
MRVVPALPTDRHCAVMSSLAAQTFSDTFAHLHSASDLHQFIQTTYSLDRILKDIQTDTVFFLCNDEDECTADPIGYCQIRWSVRHAVLVDTEEYPDPCAEIRRFYIKKDQHRTGAGTFLMRFILERAKERDVRTLWLTAMAENHNAIAFYARFGIKRITDETFVYKVGNDFQVSTAFATKLA